MFIFEQSVGKDEKQDLFSIEYMFGISRQVTLLTQYHILIQCVNNIKQVLLSHSIDVTRSNRVFTNILSKIFQIENERSQLISIDYLIDY